MSRIALFILLVFTFFLTPVMAMDIENGLKVDEVVICTGIEEKAPAGINTQFFESQERLYCYSRISGAAPPDTITHVWIFGEEEKARVRLPVKSASWRTWSSKRMMASWSGAWRVEIEDNGGRVLAVREFIYKPVEE
ncbi:MAG: DUF2914 domain-containing protein [Bacteroidales bacterium]|nr:DUF2914 domain-containing protein [Candidatus Latescibacterota bacterium]